MNFKDVLKNRVLFEDPRSGIALHLYVENVDRLSVPFGILDIISVGLVSPKSRRYRDPPVLDQGADVEGASHWAERPLQHLSASRPVSRRFQYTYSEQWKGR